MRPMLACLLIQSKTYFQPLSCFLKKNLEAQRVILIINAANLSYIRYLK